MKNKVFAICRLERANDYNLQLRTEHIYYSTQAIKFLPHKFVALIRCLI